MASLKKSHLVRIRWFGILAAAALVGGCVFFGRGSTVVDIEVAGFVSITGAAVTEAPKPLNPRGRTDGAASLSPVAEAPIRGLLVGVERVSNFEVQLSFTNQSAAPVLLSLDRGSVHFSFEPAARPIGPKPVYFLYRLDTPKVVLVQDFRTNTAGKPLMLNPNHRVTLLLRSTSRQEGGRNFQNFGVGIDYANSAIAISSVGNSMKVTFPVEIGGETLTLGLDVQSVKEHKRQSHY